MDESRNHEAFEKLLSGDSGFSTSEMAKLASLVRALEANAPTRPEMRVGFRDGLRSTLVLETEVAPVIPLHSRVRASWQARNARMRRSFRMVSTVAAAAVIMMVGGSLMAIASTAGPGDKLYGLKVAKEDLSVRLAFGNVNKANRQLDIARERLTELRALSDRGITESALYVGTLKDMDSRTQDATTRVLNEFKKTNNNATLAPLIAFAAAQRQDLEHLAEVIPPAARPKARGSVELLTAVQTRVSKVLGGCECPTDPLATVTTNSKAKSGVECTCEKKAAAPTKPSGGSNTGAPTKENPPSNQGGQGGSAGGGGSTTDNPSIIDGIAALDQQVTDTVNQTLENLGLSPNPVPSIPPLFP